MKIPVLPFRSVFTKNTLAALALGGILVFAAAPAAKANAWEDCQRRVDYSSYRYYEAVERFGPYSREARHWAHEREEASERWNRLRRDHYREYDDHYRDHDRHEHRDHDRDWR
jgi:hypothetical protein